MSILLSNACDTLVKVIFRELFLVSAMGYTRAQMIQRISVFEPDKNATLPYGLDLVSKTVSAEDNTYWCDLEKKCKKKQEGSYENISFVVGLVAHKDRKCTYAPGKVSFLVFDCDVKSTKSNESSLLRVQIFVEGKKIDDNSLSRSIPGFVGKTTKNDHVYEFFVHPDDFFVSDQGVYCSSEFDYAEIYSGIARLSAEQEGKRDGKQPSKNAKNAKKPKKTVIRVENDEEEDDQDQDQEANEDDDGDDDDDDDDVSESHTGDVKLYPEGVVPIPNVAIIKEYDIRLITNEIIDNPAQGTYLEKYFKLRNILPLYFVNAFSAAFRKRGGIEIVTKSRSASNVQSQNNLFIRMHPDDQKLFFDALKVELAKSIQERNNDADTVSSHIIVPGINTLTFKEGERHFMELVAQEIINIDPSKTTAYTKIAKSGSNMAMRRMKQISNLVAIFNNDQDRPALQNAVYSARRLYIQSLYRVRNQARKESVANLPRGVTVTFGNNVFYDPNASSSAAINYNSNNNNNNNNANIINYNNNNYHNNNSNNNARSSGFDEFFSGLDVFDVGQQNVGNPSSDEAFVSIDYLNVNANGNPTNTSNRDDFNNNVVFERYDPLSQLPAAPNANPDDNASILPSSNDQGQNIFNLTSFLDSTSADPSTDLVGILEPSNNIQNQIDATLSSNAGLNNPEVVVPATVQAPVVATDSASQKNPYGDFFVSFHDASIPTASVVEGIVDVSKRNNYPVKITKTYDTLKMFFKIECIKLTGNKVESNWPVSVSNTSFDIQNEKVIISTSTSPMDTDKKLERNIEKIYDVNRTTPVVIKIKNEDSPSHPAYLFSE